MIKHSITRAVMLVAGMSAISALAVPASASQAHARAAWTTRRSGSGRAARRAASRSARPADLLTIPSDIRVHVKASPNQHISGAWDMTCSKGSGAGGTNGTISGTTPRAKRLRMPFANPDSCIVAADAQLSGSGSIQVYLTARVP